MAGRRTHNRSFRRLIPLICLLPLSGCSTFERPLLTTDRSEHRQARNPVRQTAYVPYVVMPAPQLAADRFEGTPLASFSGRDTPTKDLLLTLFRDSDLNLLVDPDVTGMATYDIKATTVEHAFDALTKYLDLAYEFDGDFVRVRNHQNRTFTLDLLNASSSEAGSVDIWSLLKTDLPALVGESGHVLVNAIAGTIQVRAKPSAVQQIETYLDTVFERVTSQVTIEARVLEVRLRDEFRLGVNWQLLGGLLQGDYSGTLGGGQLGALGAASGGDALRVGMLKTDELSVFIDALEGQGQVRVLSSPRVSTMNNVPATLKVVDQIPVIEREIIDSEGGVRTQFDIRFVEAGITLDVTPQIGRDGYITVQVRPVITEQTGTVTTPDGLQTEPILSTREANSVLRVRDGQTMVIGGLRFLRKDETSTGIPGSTRLPFLGAAGRNQIQQTEEVELVVLLVPRIMTPAWTAEHQRRSGAAIKAVRRCFLPSTLEMNRRPGENYKCGFLVGGVACAAQPIRQHMPDVRPGQQAVTERMTITRAGFSGQLYRKAVTAFTDGELRLSLKLLEQALALDGTHADAWIYAGLTHYRLGDRKKARSHLDRALSLRPDDAVALSVRGVLEFDGGSAAAARVFLERAQRTNPNALTGNNLAAAYIAMGDVSAAAAILGTLPLNTVTLPEAHVNRAYVLLEQGRNAEARAELDRALEKGASLNEPRVQHVRRRLR